MPRISEGNPEGKQVIELPSLGFFVDLKRVRKSVGWRSAAQAWRLIANERKRIGNDVDSELASHCSEDCSRVARLLDEEDD